MKVSNVFFAANPVIGIGTTRTDVTPFLEPSLLIKQINVIFLCTFTGTVLGTGATSFYNWENGDIYLGVRLKGELPTPGLKYTIFNIGFPLNAPIKSLEDVASSALNSDYVLLDNDEIKVSIGHSGIATVPAVPSGLVKIDIKTKENFYDISLFRQTGQFRYILDYFILAPGNVPSGAPTFRLDSIVNLIT